MHVVLATDRWGEALGGREHYLANLADAARHAGHRVEVLCHEARYHRSLAARLARHPGPSLAVTPVRGATHCQLHSGLMRASLEAERDSLEPGLARWFFRTGSLLNTRRRLLLRREEHVLASANRPRLMVWSQTLRDELTRRFGIPASEITVLPPGIDGRFRPREGLDGAAPTPRADASLRLLFAAHNFRLKGLAPLLEALSRARRRGLRFRLTVAGRGPLAFRVLAARSGIAEHVDFIGAVPPASMAELYRTHDALVHPTFYDPCSLVVLEALASGCPVVTTRRNGASEWFEAGRHGLVIDDPRDTDALAKAIGALADAPRRQHMAAEAARLGSRFDFTAHAARVFAWLA
jgi:UDP-glucose:(heptosyl)LPS alpha-1,3-glucosyltransferase